MFLGNWSYGRTNSYASREKHITARHPMVTRTQGRYGMRIIAMSSICPNSLIFAGNAPFTNYNGNTFSAIMRAIIDDAGFPTDRRALARSLAGHIVAGVAEEGEVEAFRELCAKLGG